MIWNNKFRFYFALYFLLLIAACNSGYAQQKIDTVKQVPVQIFPLPELQKDIASILDNKDFTNAQIGVSIVSIESGESLFKRNDNKNCIPASTLKIITTAAALEYLGRDFRYNTTLYLDGEIEKNGEYNGNIIIRGSGDPTISKTFLDNPSSILDSWAAVLDSLGIRSIRGNIIGDDQYFSGDYYAPGWSWDDLIYPYSAQVNAISIYENKIDIIIEPDENIGEPAAFRIIPENSYIGLINHVKTVPDSMLTEIYTMRHPGTNIIEIYGFIQQNKADKESKIASVTIDNPSLFFLNLFKNAIEKRNIKFRGALLDMDDWNQKFSYLDRTPVSEYFSPPLYKIIQEVNKNSNNLTAECLLKTIAKENTGTGSFRKGCEQLNRFIARKGVADENIAVYDGSGLSRMNLLSPKIQTQLLSAFYKSNFKNDFINSLAVPGENGTLKNRMTKARASNYVFAKTGSMNGVSALCGYIFTKDNETLAFSIMISNFTGPASLANNLQDLICMRLAAFSRKRK